MTCGPPFFASKYLQNYFRSRLRAIDTWVGRQLHEKPAGDSRTRNQVAVRGRGGTWMEEEQELGGTLIEDKS